MNLLRIPGAQTNSVTTAVSARRGTSATRRQRADRLRPSDNADNNTVSNPSAGYICDRATALFFSSRDRLNYRVERLIRKTLIIKRCERIGIILESIRRIKFRRNELLID